MSDEAPSQDMLQSFAVESKPRKNSLFNQLMGLNLSSSSQPASGPEQPKWIASSSFDSSNSHQEEGRSNFNQAPFLVPLSCDKEVPQDSASDQFTDTSSQYSLPNVAKMKVRNTFIEASGTDDVELVRTISALRTLVRQALTKQLQRVSHLLLRHRPPSEFAWGQNFGIRSDVQVDS